MGSVKSREDWKLLIPYSTQHISLPDRIRVFRALGKPYLTQGPAVAEFEHAVANYVGAEHGVAVNSATSALHVACLALDLGPGDIMWTSSISFVASANCGLYCGADVDFVDIDPLTFNMSPLELQAKLETADKNGLLPKVLVVVHLAGEPAEMGKISSVARKFGVRIIEDASHALGSSYQGKKIGSGVFSDITVFSFHAVKNMTTGEGGMAVTQDERLAKAMKRLRSHGITRDSSEFLSDPKDWSPWHYEQQALGFNYRLTDFQSTLGKSQLTRIEVRNSHRRAILDTYRKELEGIGVVRFQKLSPSSQSAAHLAVMQVPATLRDVVVKALANEGYATNLHYYPIHLQPFYQSRRNYESDLAEAFAKTSISLPCHDGISLATVKRISKVVAKETAQSL